MVDDYGNAIFESIKITLVRTRPLARGPALPCSRCPCSWLQVCDECLKTGVQAPPTSTPASFTHSQSLARVVVVVAVFAQITQRSALQF